MNFGLIFFQFLPLFLYIAFEYWKGFRAGIIAAIVAAVVLIAYNYAATGEIDQFSLGECSLILVLGVVSLRMNNERLFKFQPTVVDVVLASVFIYFEIRGTPLLVRYIPHMERLFDAQQSTPELRAIIENMHSASYLHVMARLSRAMIFVLLLHGILMAYAALHMSTARWFLFRLAIYPAVVVATLVVGMASL